MGIRKQFHTCEMLCNFNFSSHCQIRFCMYTHVQKYLKMHIAEKIQL